MGLGQDKISAEVFNIEPTAVLDLFVIYPDIINYPNRAFYIHNGSVFGIGITWQGNDYKPIAMEYEGFEVTADGRPNRPLVRISNAEYFASSLLDQYDDFSNARLVRKKTFVKFLDDSNFDGGNPWGESDSQAEISEDTYIISQKRRENKEFVEVELTNPLDLETFEVNHRRVLGKYCYWKYRGSGCQYEGPPVERQDKQPFTDQNNNKVSPWTKAKQSNVSHLGQDDFEFAASSDIYRSTKSYWEGNIVYKVNDRVRIQDELDPNVFKPLITYYVAKRYSEGKDPNLHPEYWDKDGCSKQIESCKKRFSNRTQVLLPTTAKLYSQEVFRTEEASKTHMGFLQPKAGLEYMFNWSTGSGYKNGRNREFTLAIHLDRTYPYRNLGAFKETPDYNNIFNTNASSTSSGFRLSFYQRTGYGDLVINCKKRNSSGSSSPVEFWPLREGGLISGNSILENKNFNLLSCEDLIIILKMYKTTEGSYKKSFDIWITGVNTGVLKDENGRTISGTRGVRERFNIKNSFDTGVVLKSNTKSLTFLGGPTRRDSATAGTPPGFPRNWAHNASSFSSAILWNKKIPNNILNEVFAAKQVANDGESNIIRRFEDLTGDPTKRNSLLKDAKAYWQGGRSNNGPGLRENINNRDMVFKYNNSEKTALAGQGFFDYTNWTQSSVLNPGYLSDRAMAINAGMSVRVAGVESSESDTGVLPFGGFPGTDAYNFRTEP